MSYTDNIADQVAIRALHDAYSDAVFRADAEAWGALWAQDATWNLMGMEVSGQPAIVALWKQAMSQYAQASFFIQLGALAIEGDAATGRSYTNEILTSQDGAVRRVIGAYEDTYIKRDGQWLFAARSFKVVKEH